MSLTTEWRDQKKESPFPFKDGTPMTLDGDAPIGNDAILDAVIIPPPNATGSWSFASFQVGQDYSVEGVISSPSGVLLTFAKAPNESHALLLNSDLLPAGSLVFSDLWPQGSSVVFRPGSYEIDTSTSIFMDSCILSPLFAAGVGSITIAGRRITGDVALVAGTGVVFEVSNNVNPEGWDFGEVSLINLHIPGAFRECDLDPAIKGINDITPSDSGGIYMGPADYPSPESKSDPRQLVRFTPVENGLIVSLANKR